jgi:Icc protein
LLATPSTCAQFLPLAADFSVDSRPPAYRRMTLHPDGTLDTEVVWVEQAVDGLERASHRLG